MPSLKGRMRFQKNSIAGEKNATAYSCKYLLWNSRSCHVLYFETQIAIAIPEVNTRINYNCKESIIADKTWRNCCEPTPVKGSILWRKRAKYKGQNQEIEITLSELSSCIYMTNNFNNNVQLANVFVVIIIVALQ